MRKFVLPATLAGLGVTGYSTDADALTPAQAYKQTLRSILQSAEHAGEGKFGVRDIHPGMKGQIRDVIKGTPKPILDAIPSIRPTYKTFTDVLDAGIMDSNLLSELQGISSHPSVPAFMLTSSVPEIKQAGLGDAIYLSHQQPHRTLSHEKGHVLHGDSPAALAPEDLQRWKELWYGSKDLDKYMAQISGVSMHHPFEGLAESAAGRIRGMGEYDHILPKEMNDILKKYIPMAAGAGLLGSGMVSPEDAEAVRLPSVTKAMQEAIAQGGKLYYHQTWNPRDLMRQGIKDPLQYAVPKETGKPYAFYMTQQPKKLQGHVTGGYSGSGTSKALRNKLKDWRDITNETRGETPVVRVVMKPTARKRSINEVDMHYYNKALKKIREDLGDPYLGADEISQHWQDVADQLEIMNVDAQKGVSEHLLTNPNQVAGMFWENASWTPEGGYVEHGPMKYRSTLPKGAQGPVPTSSSPQAEKAYLDQYIDYAKKAPLGKFEDHVGVVDTANLLKKNLTAKPFDPDWLAQVLKDRQAVELLGPEVSVFSLPNLKALSSGAPVYDPKTMASGPLTGMPKDYSVYGLGALTAGGALAASPDQAEAMPIGKQKKLNPKILTNHPRSEDNFYHLLGTKIRNGHEVVDVRKNIKNDWRYVVLKDAQGKHTQLPMTKDYLNVFSGAKGTQDYLKKFRNEGYQGKKVQSLKSLTKRETTRENTSHMKEPQFRAWNKAQMEKAREIDPELVNDYAYVEVLSEEGGALGQSLYMPREYADFLAKKGYVKILKR